MTHPLGKEYLQRELAHAYACGRFDERLADTPTCIHAADFATQAAGLQVPQYRELYDQMAREAS